jgi:amidohydrolase
MIEDGLLDDPKVDGSFALHVDANNYVGKVSMRVGPQSAAADEFSITVRGKGGHASRPQAAVDPVVVGAHIVTALQTLVSREVSPMEPAVVTVGRLSGGTAFNVIPATAVIEGTVRTYNEGVQAHIERRLPAMVKGIAEAMRANAEVEYRRLYPLLVNHTSGVSIAREVVGELLGPDAAAESEQIMGSEDFSFVLQRAPGAMVRLGVRHKDWKQIRPTHSPEFDMDESALPVGVAVMAGMAVRFLEG